MKLKVIKRIAELGLVWLLVVEPSPALSERIHPLTFNF